jgi:ABC-type glycerol-3-phosphate transport system substrate-binding protein
MKRLFALTALLVSGLTLFGCGGGGSSKTTGSQPGAVYVTGEDAPLLPW